MQGKHSITMIGRCHLSVDTICHLVLKLLSALQDFPSIVVCVQFAFGMTLCFAELHKLFKLQNLVLKEHLVMVDVSRNSAQEASVSGESWFRLEQVEKSPPFWSPYEVESV